MPYRLSFRLSIVTLATNRGKGLGIPSGSEPGVSAVAREIKPITWHYTHRNLLPQIIWRESKHKHISSFDHSWDSNRLRGGTGKGKYERRESSRVRESFGVRGNKTGTRLVSGMGGRYSERESGKLRRWARVVELSACSLPLCSPPPTHSGFSPLNLAEARGFPRQRRASLFIVG